jgi:hypothetical protein
MLHRLTPISADLIGLSSSRPLVAFYTKEGAALHKYLRVLLASRKRREKQIISFLNSNFMNS